jgi:hypothetical protein
MYTGIDPLHWLSTKQTDAWPFMKKMEECSPQRERFYECWEE